MIGLLLLALAILAVIAVVPAVIAQRKGESALTWWLYGFLLWPVAMIHAVWLGPIDRWHAEMNQLRAGLIPASVTTAEPPRLDALGRAEAGRLLMTGGTAVPGC